VAEALLEPDVAKLMQKLHPELNKKKDWPKKEMGIVYIAQAIECEFNAQPMVHNKRELEHRFDAFVKMSPSIQATWHEMFPRRDYVAPPPKRKRPAQGVGSFGWSGSGIGSGGSSGIDPELQQQ